MTKPLSLRAPPSLIAAIDDRAAQLGQNRTKYILSLVENDLNQQRPKRRHRFISAYLVGSIRTGIKHGDNTTIRRVIRQRLNEKAR